MQDKQNENQPPKRKIRLPQGYSSAGQPSSLDEVQPLDVLGDLCGLPPEALVQQPRTPPAERTAPAAQSGNQERDDGFVPPPTGGGVDAAMGTRTGQEAFAHHCAAQAPRAQRPQQSPFPQQGQSPPCAPPAPMGAFNGQRQTAVTNVPPYGQPAQPYRVVEIELPLARPTEQTLAQDIALPQEDFQDDTQEFEFAAENGFPFEASRDDSMPPVPPEKPPKGRKKGSGNADVPTRKKRKLRSRLLTAFGLVLVCGFAFLWAYCQFATRYDFLWLDLPQLQHRDATVLYAKSTQGGWEEYARLEATQQKLWTPLAEIPLQLQQAFVAIEDKNFYKHNGVSWSRTIFAILNEAKHTLTGTYFGGENGIKQGASTIHQQLIKNLTTDDHTAGLQGYFRKVREIYRAYKMNATYTKDEVMEAYLNVIGFTGNTAGVQAESYKLYGVPVSQLSLAQCASIAAITKNPYRYDPTRNPDTHLSRRNYILYEMAQQGYITNEAYEAASAEPVGLFAGTVPVAKTQITSYFTDQVIEDVSNQLQEKYALSREETTYLLYNGGLRIYTTVDAALQAAMEKNLTNGWQFPTRGLGIATQKQVYDESGKRVLDESGNAVLENVTEYPQAAMVSVGYDGGLKAVVGGLGEKEVSRGFNRGTAAVRQVGSTMKPIGAYVLALEKNKINWSTPFLDAPVRKIEDEGTRELRDWPANVTKLYTEKDILVADAMAQSVNTVAVRVGERAGIGAMYRFQKKIGISSFIAKDKAPGPMVLGSSTYGVTPYELAGAYMMFGNGGKFTTLHSFTSVETGYGEPLLRPKLETAQVIGSDTAYIMNQMLGEVMSGAGTAAGYGVGGTMDSVGKTGTTSDNRDYWFVGLTPYYVTATWYGYDSSFALNTAQGTHAPTTAWKSVMEQGQRGLAALPFPVDATVEEHSYCTESGGLPTPNCPRTALGYYRAEKLPAVCRLHAA